MDLAEVCVLIYGTSKRTILTCDRFMDPFNHWTFLRTHLGNLGDFYATVSPSSFHFESMNAEINTQVANRRAEFEKPVEMYILVNVFGRNALTSDGPDWRRQRKIISPGFTERNNARVWELGLKQGQSMLEYWASKEESSIDELKVRNTALDTATIALHIICGAGFGIPQIWPHEDESILGDKKMAGLNTKLPAEGHKLTFKEALVYTTGLRIAWFSVFPEWVLRKRCTIRIRLH
jgi:cytochrome P450